MAKVKMTLHGAKELEEALRELPKRIGKNVLKRALLNAAQPVADEAARSAPVRTGRLKISVDASTKLSKRQRRRMKGKSADAYAFVGAGPSRVAHLIEFGTGPRQHKKTGESKSGRKRTPGKNTGQVPAQPFMRPAWENGKDQVLSDIGTEIWTEIEKANARIARKALRAAGKKP